MSRRVRCAPILAALALLLVTSGSSWAATIVIDDFDDDNYSDDGLIFDARMLTFDASTTASIDDGALGVLYFVPGQTATLEYSSSAGITMTEAGGFVLEGVLLDTTGQTMMWTWTARDNGTELASNSGTWTVGNQPLFMGPDGAGDYTGWKTLTFTFEWPSGNDGPASISASRLVAVPEPSSLALCGFALGIMGYGYRRIRRADRRG